MNRHDPQADEAVREVYRQAEAQVRAATRVDLDAGLADLAHRIKRRDLAAKSRQAIPRRSAAKATFLVLVMAGLYGLIFGAIRLSATYPEAAPRYVLVAGCMILAGVLVAFRTRSGALVRLFTQAQWLILHAGIAAIAVTTLLLAPYGPDDLPPGVNGQVKPRPTMVDPPTVSGPTVGGIPTPAPSLATDPNSPTSATSPGSPSGVVGREYDTTYLDSVRPLAGSYEARPVTLSGVRYPRGVTIACGAAVVWPASGAFRLVLTAGVEDSAPIDVVIDVVWSDQDGNALGRSRVSAGHPVKIDMSIRSLLTINAACTAWDASTGALRAGAVALGNPALLSQ